MDFKRFINSYHEVVTMLQKKGEIHNFLTSLQSYLAEAPSIRLTVPKRDARFNPILLTAFFCIRHHYEIRSEPEADSVLISNQKAGGHGMIFEYKVALDELTID